jgi:hypothetical protein
MNRPRQEWGVGSREIGNIADEAAYQKKLQITREYFQPNMEVLENPLMHPTKFDGLECSFLRRFFENKIPVGAGLAPT